FAAPNEARSAEGRASVNNALSGASSAYSGELVDAQKLMTIRSRRTLVKLKVLLDRDRSVIRESNEIHTIPVRPIPLFQVDEILGSPRLRCIQETAHYED